VDEFAVLQALDGRDRVREGRGGDILPYLPTNPWARGKCFKDIAMLWQEDIASGLEGISLKVMGNFGWSVSCNTKKREAGFYLIPLNLLPQL
jgi:hypothetical protein